MVPKLCILLRSFHRPLLSRDLSTSPHKVLNGSTVTKARKNDSMAEADKENGSRPLSDSDKCSGDCGPSLGSGVPRSQQGPGGESREESTLRMNQQVFYYNQQIQPSLSASTSNFSYFTWQPYYPYFYNQNYQPPYNPYFHRPGPARHPGNSRNGPACSIEGLRRWEPASRGSKGGEFNFSVMSYNVLAQILVQQHPYLYSAHSPRSLKWEIRWENLLKEIQHLSPDILCLQEVQASHLETHFSALEALGYSTKHKIYKQRTGIRSDGCAIYYKPDKLTLTDHVTVEYNQPDVSMLDRDNVAIIAKFSPKKFPHQHFVVATTHLLYNPKRQDVRLAQTQVLLTEIDRVAYHNEKCDGGTASQRNGNTKGNSSYWPVILTGDLNSQPDSAVVRFITGGRLEYENLTVRSLLEIGRGQKCGKSFLPQSLKITDNCQHASLLPKRQTCDSLTRSEEFKLIELKHSEFREESAKKSETTSEATTAIFSSGTLSHNLSLRSVYDFIDGTSGDLQATTYQDQWVTVDYIFYGQDVSCGGGRLRPVERYRLPTDSELGSLRFPNDFLGSDHLSLMAKFQLSLL